MSYSQVNIFLTSPISSRDALYTMPLISKIRTVSACRSNARMTITRCALRAYKCSSGFYSEHQHQISVIGTERRNELPLQVFTGLMRDLDVAYGLLWANGVMPVISPQLQWYLHCYQRLVRLRAPNRSRRQMSYVRQRRYLLSYPQNVSPLAINIAAQSIEVVISHLAPGFDTQLHHLAVS